MKNSNFEKSSIFVNFEKLLFLPKFLTKKMTFFTSNEKINIFRSNEKITILLSNEIFT